MSDRTRCRASPCPYRSDQSRAGATFWWYTRGTMSAVGARGGSRRVTVSGESPEAAVAALAEALRAGGERPSAIVAFASWRFDPEHTAAALESAFAPAPVIGCTSIGELGEDGDREGTISALALFAP